VARYVISPRAKTTKATPPMTTPQVHGLLEQHGIAVVRSNDAGVLVDCTDEQAGKVAPRLQGWVMAPEREYGYPKRNPGLKNAKKAFR
jgi:hypothetical protein